MNLCAKLANSLPKVGSVDKGTWRRLIVVPFLNTIPDSEVQTDFLEKLYASEASAVLQWIIEGAKLFIENKYKLETPNAVRKATEQYAAAENWVANFVEECCETGPNCQEQGGRLYDAYRAWTQSNGEYTRRSTDFAAALEGTGFVKRRVRTGTEWQAIRLTSTCNNRVCGHSDVQNSHYD